MAYTFSCLDNITPEDSISVADTGSLIVVTIAITKELTMYRTRDDIIGAISRIVAKAVKVDHKVILLLDGSEYAVITS